MGIGPKDSFIWGGAGATSCSLSVPNSGRTMFKLGLDRQISKFIFILKIGSLEKIDFVHEYIVIVIVDLRFHVVVDNCQETLSEYGCPEANGTLIVRKGSQKDESPVLSIACN